MEATLQEIAGMNYTRLPVDGEWLDIEAWSDKGGMVSCLVYACTGNMPMYESRSIIAWDQVEVPRKVSAGETSPHQTAYRKRLGLAAKARDYWHNKGAKVRFFASDDI